MSLLVTIEGIEGSGKTTLVSNLKKSGELDLVNYNWQDTEWGQKFWRLITKTQVQEKKSWLSNIFSAFAELNQKVIEPNLQKNKVVIIDGWIDRIFARQFLEKRIVINIIYEVSKSPITLPSPDITFLLDIEPQQSQERLKKSKLTTEKYTKRDNLKLEFHNRIRNHYLELKKIFPERIYIINAEKSENEILEEVKSIIKNCLPEEGKKNNLPSFVRIAIRNKKGEFLLVRDKWGWNFLGGKIEKDETPKEAAKRELFEETNLVAEDLEEIAKKTIFYANLPKGNQHWEGHFFRANKCSGEIEIKETEKIFDIKFMNYNFSEKQQPYQFYWEKIKKVEKYAE